MTRALKWNGYLMMTGDGLRCGAMYDDGEGGTWAWLDRPATMGDWEGFVRACGGDLDRASDRIVEKFGGHSGYLPTRWPQTT